MASSCHTGRAGQMLTQRLNKVLQGLRGTIVNDGKQYAHTLMKPSYHILIPL